MPICELGPIQEVNCWWTVRSVLCQIFHRMCWRSGSRRMFGPRSLQWGRIWSWWPCCRNKCGHSWRCSSQHRVDQLAFRHPIDSRTPWQLPDCHRFETCTDLPHSPECTVGWTRTCQSTDHSRTEPCDRWLTVLDTLEWSRMTWSWSLSEGFVLPAPCLPCLCWPRLLSQDLSSSPTWRRSDCRPRVACWSNRSWWLAWCLLVPHSTSISHHHAARRSGARCGNRYGPCESFPECAFACNPWSWLDDLSNSITLCGIRSSCIP